jgi:predicted enzyme related to lactoylglutathione lyase
MMDPAAGLPSHWVAYFSVADTDAAVAAATGQGGALQGDPMDAPFGRIAFLTDPEGAVFALAGPSRAT